MASTSCNHSPEYDRSDSYVPFPEPPSSEPPALPVEQFIAELNDVPLTSDPPPPYPSGSRKSRRARANTARSTRRAMHVSDHSQVSSLPPHESGGESETSPLLGGRRPRTTSHSSTVYSVQSLAHTVINSSRTMISLFEADPDSSLVLTARSTSGLPLSARAKRYFAPLRQRKYYAALFHLFFVNFPFELVAWIYLFVGTLTGTTLLITLPIGLIICFLNLLGARMLARCEITLQTYFHGPLTISPPNPPHPIFSRMRTHGEVEDNLEHGQQAPESVPETSFLRLSFLMFSDPTSYQALFYFLVIKPGLTLLITLSFLILVPPAFILVVPAPAVLRAAKRVGIWQADVAMDALS